MAGKDISEYQRMYDNFFGNKNVCQTWENCLSRRRLFILSFFLVCIISITVGFLYWYSEQRADLKLQDYLRRLRDEGFTTEEHSLADFHVDGSVRIHFFSDFRSFAKQEDIDHIYIDRGITCSVFST